MYTRHGYRNPAAQCRTRVSLKPSPGRWDVVETIPAIYMAIRAIPARMQKKTLTDLISQPSLRAGLIQRPDTLVLPLCLGPASHRREQLPQVLTSPARSVAFNWIPTRPVFPCALTRLQQIGTAELGTNVPRRTRRSYAVELTGSGLPSSVMTPRRGLPSLALPRSAVSPGTYADTVRLGISPRMGWNEWTSAYKNFEAGSGRSARLPL